ncbi:MAG: iron-sulfur cluster repair di-iron protein [Bacteroidales bacterium]
MKYLYDRSLAEIVSADYRASRVFQKYGIDFCCGGKQSFLEACNGLKIDPQVIEKEIENALVNNEEIDFSALSPTELIQFILKEHHEYVRSESMYLQELSEKVKQAHVVAHPELAEIASVVKEIMVDMDLHQMKEERILFPFIEALEVAISQGGELPKSCFGSVQNPIRNMEHDHDQVGQYLFRLKDLTQNYSLPQDACESYKALYKRLEAFQNNTFRHVHLENNILFVKAINLQKQI